MNPWLRNTVEGLTDIVHVCRPPGLAWEVRKTTSPSKHRSQQPARKQEEKRVASGAVRSLEFEETRQKGGAPLVADKKPPTWADRVRGVAAVSQGGTEGDGEGWETVTRGRKGSPHCSRPSSGTQGGRERQPSSISTHASVPDLELPETTPTSPPPSIEQEISKDVPTDPCREREKVPIHAIWSW